MIKKRIEIINRSGLHDRLGTSFIRKASQYKSQIFISKGRSKMSAKSILGFFSLGISEGDVIEIEVNGEDEDIAIKELIEYIIGIDENK
ncbi:MULTISPECIES: HPr family phosphocarrier protein [unclassified Romboutsia]|uniref:HPr family phosphocarrier protein n=1 Tax=unclassified Romboutsia TaxID=2626894 RepID=UPI0008218DFD|nr:MULTISPECIES: HPr family phosphocarrier protein [unclassified Romboutsia]SCI27077.1 Catabolite repression HPr [uncultured Clostridium sp.]